MNGIKKVDEDLLKDNRYIKNIEYLKTLASIYFSSHVINIIDDTVEEIITNDQVETMVNKTTNAAIQMKKIIKYTVSLEHLNMALEFTDLSTLNSRMHDKKILSQDFIGKFHGWTRFQFIVNSYDKLGNVETVLFLTRVIDEEKKSELELLRYSLTDELTGLNNRRAYEKSLIDLKKYKENLVIFAFDVNGLKKANDILGHIAGDELIRAAANIISNFFNGIGTAYRTGGDEFIAIMHRKDEDLDLMVKKIKNLSANWTGVFNKTLSISVGYARYEELNDCNIERLANLADYRMYEDKKLYYQK